MTPRDHHARFLAALNDGPHQVIGWPAFHQANPNLHIGRDQRLDQMWLQRVHNTEHTVVWTWGVAA